MFKKLLKKGLKEIQNRTFTPVYYDQNMKQGYCGKSICASDLQGKNVLITGGSRGIGFSIAYRMLLEGCNVIITGRNEESLTQSRCLLEKVADNGKSIDYFLWDQESLNNINNMFDQAITMFDNRQLDILINNAGIFTDVDRKRKFRTVGKMDFERIFRINFESTYLITQRGVQHMLEFHKKGSIINIASVCGITSEFMHTPYGLSKAEVVELTKLLGDQYKDSDIHIVGIAPGTVVTGLSEWKENDNIAYKGNYLKRAVIPEEIAALAAFLSSKYGRYLSGNTIVASSGERFS